MDTPKLSKIRKFFPMFYLVSLFGCPLTNASCLNGQLFYWEVREALMEPYHRIQPDSNYSWMEVCLNHLQSILFHLCSVLGLLKKALLGLTSSKICRRLYTYLKLKIFINYLLIILIIAFKLFRFNSIFFKVKWFLRIPHDNNLSI